MLIPSGIKQARFLPESYTIQLTDAKKTVRLFWKSTAQVRGFEFENE